MWMLVFMIVLFSYPFVYYIWYYKSFVSQEYFSIKLVEKKRLVFLKKLLLIAIELLLCGYLVGSSIFSGGMVEGWKGILILFLIILYGTVRYFKRGYRCIPLSDTFDKEKLRESIESEHFTQLKEYVWESEHWVKIEHLFFPKNAILCFKVHGGTVSSCGLIDIFAINGKVCKTRYGTDIKCMSFFEMLPIVRSKVYQDNDMAFYEIMGIMKKNKKQIRTLLNTYLESHTVEDIIQKDELLNQIIELYEEDKEVILKERKEKYRERYRKKKQRK